MANSMSLTIREQAHALKQNSKKWQVTFESASFAMYLTKYFMSADFIQWNEYQQPKINPLVTVYLSNNYPITCAPCTPAVKPQ